jgi:GntR family colanic acid and biofilm gene transcriptional regulator
MNDPTDKPLKTGMPRGRPAVIAPALEPLDATSEGPVDRQVYQAIRKSLMAGAIQPGSKLSSRSIAGALGVSQMPVREALKRLDADGVLRSSAKSAFVVHNLTQEEYREILAVRLPLEGLLIRRATERVSAAEIDMTFWLVDRMKASRDWRHVLKYNFDLHFLLYRSAEMPYVLSIVENIWLRIGPALHMVNEAMPIERVAEPLDEVVAAVRARDPDRAEAALHADILLNADNLLARL